MSDYKVKKTDAEWRAQLDPMQYQVTRHAATERPFSGKYWDHGADGVYRCVACGEPLFDSQTKFDAGCGWPSYFQPVEKAAIEREIGPQPRHGARGGQVPELRGPSRPCVRRWAGADR